MSALRKVWQSMSGRLLVLTVLFVMLAEILIFVPSVARFRHDFLIDKLDKGRLAALAALASSDGLVRPGLQMELLSQAGVLTVSIKREERRQLILSGPIDLMVGETFDVRDDGPITLIIDAIACAFQFQRRLITVKGESFAGQPDLEVVIDEAELKAAMLGYGGNIFVLSLIISAITATLVFVSVNRFLMRPIRRVIDSLVQFRDNPEDGGRIITPSGVSGEIGLAEWELAEQQRAVSKALQQKSRLAALGEAVAKINHDLRNILASAQLLADRLAESRDPAIERVGSKLVGSLDRAIRLCKQTLAYGRAEEPPPEFAQVEVAELASEIAMALDLREGGARQRAHAGAPLSANGAQETPTGRAKERRDAQIRADQDLQGGPEPAVANGAASQPVAFVNGAPDGLTAIADPDQLFRALLNLARNAKQAIEATGRSGVIAIEARRAPGAIEIDVVDNGPGLPEKARENLFKAFKGSVRKGGSGLGMAIAAELVRGQGGDLSLEESTGAGARFRIKLPDRAEGQGRPGASGGAANEGKPA